VLIDDQDEKVQAQLSRAKYALNVPGRAVIQLSRSSAPQLTDPVQHADADERSSKDPLDA